MWTQIAHASTILVGLEVYYSFMGTNIEDFLRAVVRIIERIFVYEICVLQYLRKITTGD